MSPSSSIGCIQTISEPIARSTQTVHLSCVKISTIFKWSEIPHGQRHLGVPSGASKTIFEPMIRSTQTVHLPCNNISTISKQTETSFHLTPTLLQSTIGCAQRESQAYGTFDANRAPMSHQDKSESPNRPKRVST